MASLNSRKFFSFTLRKKTSLMKNNIKSICSRVLCFAPSLGRVAPPALSNGCLSGWHWSQQTRLHCSVYFWDFSLRINWIQEKKRKKALLLRSRRLFWYRRGQLLSWVSDQSCCPQSVLAFFDRTSRWCGESICECCWTISHSSRHTWEWNRQLGEISDSQWTESLLFRNFKITKKWNKFRKK